MQNGNSKRGFKNYILSPSRFTDESLLRDYAVAPSQKKKKEKKKIVQVAFSSRVPLPNKSRSPRSVIERTHPAHLNLILKFISTWAQGQASPKEIQPHQKRPGKGANAALYPKT